ncbi:Interferon omega-1 [Galemys pyrenaicus]|nr:Interferon omega-1 [Galemys pyrenaicus]
MALLLSLVVALAALSCCSVGSLGCDQHVDHVEMTKNNSELLSKLERTAPSSCLENRRNFRFPSDALNGSQFQKTQAMAILQEMLWQTLKLFSTDHSSAVWNQTLLDPLLCGLSVQLNHLGACLGEKRAEKDPAALGIEGPWLALKKYFMNIRLKVTKEEFSDCDWEVVRVEIGRALSLSKTLQERASMKVGDLGSWLK